MTLPVFLTAEAEADLDEAAKWYEARCQGLGIEFVAEVRSAINFIATNSGIYAEIHAGLRRAPVKRFPYGIFYYERDGRLNIAGVLHDRRNPTIWKSRV